MKRINMLPPFDSFQGNMGSKQDLRYQENDNKAFESPAGRVNYAKNYKPRFIAARVARTGLNYFAVKVKSAFHATAKALKRAALMGATSAIYGVTLKDAAKLAQLQLLYVKVQEDGFEGTFHKWLHAIIMNALEVNAATIVAQVGASTVSLGNNPYTNASTAIAISAKLLAKFWDQLCATGISFTVDGAKGIAIGEDTFQEVIDVVRINVLGLTTATVGASNFVKLGDKWLKSGIETYVQEADDIVANHAYTLTDVAPEA